MIFYKKNIMRYKVYCIKKSLCYNIIILREERVKKFIHKNNNRKSPLVTIMLMNEARRQE